MPKSFPAAPAIPALSSWVQFWNEIVLINRLQFSETLGKDFDRVVDIEEVLGPVLVIAIAVNEYFLRQKTRRVRDPYLAFR